MEGQLFSDHREEIDETTARFQHYAERARAQRDVRATISSVYRSVWDEFYAWEPQGCLQAIDNLAPPALSVPDDFFWDAPSNDEMDVDGQDPGLSFVVWHLGQRRLATSTCLEFPVDEIVAHPKYESCTPAGRNVKVLDDPKLLRFIQYAGEPGFDEVEHSKIYKTGFTWQSSSHIDPDARLVAWEAAWRLKTHYSLPYEVIEGHQVLPRLLGDGDEGLLWTVKQRDLLYWPGSTVPEEGDCPRWETHSPPAQDLGAQLNKHYGLFCPSLNCIEALCMTHKFHPPPLEPFIPLVSSTMMVSHRESQAPCGPDCFLSIKEDSMDIVDFAQSELEILDGILRLFPDILPCTLAYLCKISCYKIYVERCFLYNDADITANAGLPHKSRDLPSEFEDDGTNKVQNHLRFTPVDFCSHPGPCDKHAGCVCFQRNQHCKRSCRCSLKCRLRRKGCRCGQNKCSDSCPCLRAGWECDPEVCLVKKTRVKPRRETQRAPNMTRHQCQNMKFQRAQHYQLEVKTGSYGLGTFAVRAIPKNKYIGEYVSEYMDNTAEGPGVIHKHRRMNYLFELNSTWCLDAAFLGNETRYINHPPNADDTNVVADVKLVNGEHRIAFISLKAIKAGAELLLDYGLAYWKDHA